MNQPALKFVRLPFGQLSAPQLYEVLALRAEVFVVEQHCAYLDPDGKDRDAWHLMGYSDSGLVAYARVLTLPEEGAAIGRVVVHPQHRGCGLGRLLMQEALAHAAAIAGTGFIRISAQCYLQQFYESLSFQAISAPYEEDGIPHIAMQLAGEK